MKRNGFVNTALPSCCSVRDWSNRFEQIEMLEQDIDPVDQGIKQEVQ